MIPDYSQFGNVDFSTGKVPGIGNLAHSELWKDCVAAWCPSLGKTVNTWFDYSGNRHHGIISGFSDPNSSWGNGAYTNSSAYGFNGATSVVTVPDADDLDGMPSLTISAFVNMRNNGGGGYGRIIEKNGTTPYMMLNNTSARYSVYIDGGGSTIDGRVLNVQQHLCYTYANDYVKLYLDGVLTYEGSLVKGDLETNASDVTIGNNLAANRGFSGMIDDVRIYSRALSNSEVATLSRFPRVAYEINPVKRFYVETPPTGVFFDPFGSLFDPFGVLLK